MPSLSACFYHQYKILLSLRCLRSGNYICSQGLKKEELAFKTTLSSSFINLPVAVSHCNCLNNRSVLGQCELINNVFNTYFFWRLWLDRHPHARLKGAWRHILQPRTCAFHRYRGRSGSLLGLQSTIQGVLCVCFILKYILCFLLWICISSVHDVSANELKVREVSDLYTQYNHKSLALGRLVCPSLLFIVTWVNDCVGPMTFHFSLFVAEYRL